MINIYYTPVPKLSGFLKAKKIKYKLFVSENNSKFTYPHAEIDSHLYYLLTREKYFIDLFDPLEYFNTLYKQAELIFNNLNCVSEVSSYLYRGKEDRKNYFLMGSMHYLLCHLNHSLWMLPPYNFAEPSSCKSRKLEDFLMDIEDKINDLYDTLTKDTNNDPGVYEFLPNQFELKYGKKTNSKISLNAIVDLDSNVNEESKSDKLKRQLEKFGFFNLPKVIRLSAEGRKKLIEFISSDKQPYGIAMFDYLGFIDHLSREHFRTIEKRDLEISRWFNPKSLDETNISGLIRSLVKKPSDGRFRAHLKNEQVQKDYQSLK